TIRAKLVGMTLRFRALVRLLLPLAVFLAAAAPAGAYAPDDLAPAAVRSQLYHPVVLSDDGRVSAAQLERETAELRPEMEAGAAEIVVLVHGFNTSLRVGRSHYEQIA